MSIEIVTNTANAKIRSFILKNGFINIKSFFEIASFSNDDSYYRNKMPLGTKGDFITAPEISQMFGEIIAVYILDVWQKDFHSSKVNLVELGPGRGLLMYDILNATKHIPNFHDSISIYLLDINPKLKNLQQKALAKYDKNNIHLISNISEISDEPSIVIANEFFDCFGPRQFIKKNDTWHENVVKINKKDNFYIDSILLEDNLVIERLASYNNAASDGIVEINFQAEDFMHALLMRISSNKLCGLIVDYGYFIDPLNRPFNTYNSSLQALRNHKFVNIFDDIGNVDLTSHIDFFALKSLLEEKNFVAQLYSQKEFLLKFGLQIRHKILSDLNPLNVAHLNYQYDYLINKMGELFKVLEFHSL